jgi:hypothetical protein
MKAYLSLICISIIYNCIAPTPNPNVSIADIDMICVYYCNESSTSHKHRMVVINV